MSRPRRTQQQLLYAAECHAPPGREFESQVEIQAWVDQLTAQPWWEERWPRVRYVECPTIHRREGEGSVGDWREEDWSGQIEMHRNHWHELAVCHELAHVLATSEGAHGHDPLFARTYLVLVFMALGREAWLDLRLRFVKHGVRFDERVDS